MTRAAAPPTINSVTFTTDGQEATMTTTLTRSALDTLIGGLDSAIRASDPGMPTVDAVGTALQPFLGRRDLLRPEQRQGNPNAYRQHLLHVAADGAFSLVALVWLPGQATAIHDHVSWCVVGVHQGAEHETRYTVDPDGFLVESGQGWAGVGDVAGLLPPGDIHKVSNSGTELAISLHVYGADLSRTGTSIRRRYDLPIRST